MIKEEIIKNINTVINTTVPIKTLEIPKNKTHGDFATPISFTLAKTLKKAPKIIAETLCETLNQSPELKKVATFSSLNGFINMTLCPNFMWTSICQFTPLSYFPKSTEKILLEYVSANPTGPLHIGHGRWAIIGSVLTHLLQYTNHSVESEFYINDAGNQISTFYNSINAVKEGKPIPEDGYHGQYIHDLANNTDDPLQSSIDDQKQTLKDIGVTFDNWFSEKTLHGSLEKTLKTLKENGWTYKKEGALWFKASQLGDKKDRVLIKTDGSYTYFAVDIAYHDNKMDRGFTHLINIWGADHHGYMARVNAAITALSKKNKKNTLSIIIGQLVNLIRDGQPVRMSKRTGDMITLSEVIQEIGADATRYFLIEHRADTHLEFDLALAKKQSSENPVYYIQYAHARLCSILKKLEISPSFTYPNTVSDLTPEEHKLLLILSQWPDDAWSAAEQRQPYQVAQYALKLAQTFHSFYKNCPIITASSNTKIQRTALLLKTQEILKDVFSILGISAPEKM